MTSRRVRAQALVKWVVVLACAAAGAAQAGDREDRQRPDRPQLHSVRDDSGVLVTISTNGFIDERNPFFRPLGSNGRSCVTCHQPQEGWTMTPKGLRERFDETQGTDPVFRLVDGADSPLADVSTRQAREKAYSMLLDKGLIRIGLADSADGRVRARRRRRPVRLRERAPSCRCSAARSPSTNLRFLSTVMWDGRETLATPIRSCACSTR